MYVINSYWKNVKHLTKYVPLIIYCDLQKERTNSLLAPKNGEVKDQVTLPRSHINSISYFLNSCPNWVGSVVII